MQWFLGLFLPKSQFYRKLERTDFIPLHFKNKDFSCLDAVYLKESEARLKNSLSDFSVVNTNNLGDLFLNI